MEICSPLKVCLLMKSKRTLLLNFLLPLILVIVLAVINSFSINSIKQRFETSNRLQNQNLEVLTEATYLSEQMSQIHLSVENSLKAAIAGKISNASLFRIHANAVNSLNRIAERIKKLSQTRQVLDASPQDGKLLLDHFVKYRELVIMTTDISSIDPKAAGQFVDRAQNQYSDFSGHAHHISTLLAAHAKNLNDDDQQLLDAVFERVTLTGSIVLFGTILLSAFAARMILTRINIQQ